VALLVTAPALRPASTRSPRRAARPARTLPGQRRPPLIEQCRRGAVAPLAAHSRTRCWSADASAIGTATRHQGGTTFTFVTDGIESALAQARAAAGERNVAIAGGAATINQYLRADHIDELRTHVVPVTLGAGARLFEDVPALNLEIISTRGASLVTHITYRVLR